MTRLRLGLSQLKEHKFNQNFKDFENLLSPCSLQVKCISHFPALAILFNIFESVDQNALTHSDPKAVKLLRYGSNNHKLQQN